MLSHLVTVCLALLPFVQCIEIHKYMTPEEVRKTFQTGHDNVPPYEVVRIYHTLDKRDVNDNSPRMVKINALDRSVSLYLDPYDSSLAGEQTPVYTVTKDSTEPEGIKYTLQPNALDNFGQAYQNVSKRSAIIAYEGEDGETLVQGHLTEDLSVVPLPHRLHDIILRETRELEDSFPDGIDGEADFRRSHHHVVFKRRASEMDTLNDCINAVKRDRRSEPTAAARSRRSIPSIVYPEILPIVDFRLYTALGNNVTDAARYVLAFWNAVDLRYRLLEEPKIRLSISGIIISQSPEGTPYLENHRRDSNKVDASLALPAISQYFYKIDKLRLVTYDLTIVMTHLDMCLMTNGVCDGSTCGYAYVKGACYVMNSAKKTKSVGLIEDNGGYSGINIAAHELGHFAPASSCLRNTPPLDIPLRRLLPGQLMTADEQCAKFYSGSTACENGPMVCTALSCKLPGTEDCRIQSAAAEGTPCGAEMYCINGYCVSKKAITVPHSGDKSGRK